MDDKEELEALYDRYIGPVDETDPMAEFMADMKRMILRERFAFYKEIIGKGPG